MYLFIVKTCIHLSLFRNRTNLEVQGNCWNVPSKCSECGGLVMFCLQPNSFASLLHLFVIQSCCSADLPFVKHTIPWYYSRNSVFLRLSSPCQPSALRALSKTRLVFIKCEVLAFAKVRWKLFILLWTNNWVWPSLQAPVSSCVPSLLNRAPC